MRLMLSALSNTLVMTVLVVLLIVPAANVLLFALRCLSWATGALQALMVGATLPDFWG